MSGHGIIINLSSGIPFVFQYNPEEVDNQKKINYFTAPNIGGSSNKKYFTGFDNREVKVNLVVIDKVSPLGVMNEIEYFKQLTEPDPGILGIAGSFFGNANYPPPQVLYGFGVSIVPLKWYVMDCPITETHFKDGQVSGRLGIPIRAVISLYLALDEDSALFKMNQISSKANAIAGSTKSVLKEARQRLGERKDHMAVL